MYRSNQQDRIDAPVQLRAVGHLRVLAPYYLARLGHQAELGYVHFDDSP